MVNMKKIGVILFMLIILSGSLSGYDKHFPDNEKYMDDTANIDGDKSRVPANESDDSDVPRNYLKKRKMINMVFFGIEDGPRTDTIIFSSFKPEDKKACMIFIPRDTYYHEEGFDNGDLRKINSKYGRSGEKGAMEAVGKLLRNVQVDHYVSVKYEGVREIVDAIGGVEVDVEHSFEGIPAGRQVLNGEQSLKYLRYRHGYPDADLGRIKAQQRFLKSAINKLNSIDLITLAKIFYTHVNTDMNIIEIISYANRLKGISADSITMVILPGRAEYKEVGGRNWSYFIHDPEKVRDLVKGL
jgi:LCP family protein required for cell wall assembly